MVAAMEAMQASRQSSEWNLLVVDDERAIREGCREIALGAGFNAMMVESAEAALKALESHSFDVVLLDLKLPGMSGIEALRQIRSRRPETIVIIITGYASVNSAVQAMKIGAYDYITKPFGLQELRTLLMNVGGELKAHAERRAAKEKLQIKQGTGAIVGRSPEMEKLYRIVSKAAQSTHPVLIQGESGTGKELIARSIHFSGPCKDKPFIAVDCAALVPTSIESELFGYVKGAFNGANRAKDGLLALADGGTIFLDEIGEIPLDLQSKLLRAIQEREIHPVGGTKRVPINVRILAATNRDLEAAVAEGKFRRDLYFRLNILTLRIPPLRERKQDIPLLAQHFLERFGQIAGVKKTLNENAMKALTEYDWPGNVRELENCIERACTMSTGSVLDVSDLSAAVQSSQFAAAARDKANRPNVVTIAELEKEAILKTIEDLKGDKLMAARLLGIGKTTLYRKLKEYGTSI